MTDATGRFAALVRRPEDDIALDEGALLIALHAHEELDVGVRLGQLDTMADAMRSTHPTTLAEALFVDLGFAGNTVDYYDPANSYLDDVLDRRLGIPITLSVLMIEVGRRRGIALHGVGMPGHFLVGTAGRDEWYDPFHGGAGLDRDGCVELFARTHDPNAFDPRFLDRVGPRAILDRMLANLQQSLLARSPGAAAWPTRLRLRFPDVPLPRRAELAALLGSLGQFSEAASAFDALAADLSGDEAANAAGAAARLRARAN